MKWNDGRERALFEKEQAKLRKKYLAAGMTEAQIQEMRRFDEDWYRNQRRAAKHTQNLEIETSEDEDEKMENPLYKKFFEKLAAVDKHSDFSRYGWIEEIEDKKFYLAIKGLSDADKELLTKYIFDGLSQTEIAQSKGVVKVVICKKIKRIKKYFEKFLKNG